MYFLRHRIHNSTFLVSRQSYLNLKLNIICILLLIINIRINLLYFYCIIVNVGEDCPVFDGLYEFCQLSAGGSVAAAVKLNKQVN